NYTASNATGTLTIQGTATLTLSNLTQTYDGSPKAVIVTTTPGGLSGVSITFNASATAPTNAGSYPVVASLNNALYTASNATGTLTPHTDTSSPTAITTTTTPALISVSITYDGSATAPTNAGSYRVVASLLYPNYTASNATGTLIINKATATLTLSNLTQGYD